MDCKIYVVCLASYNAGLSYGKWIDCSGKDVEDLQEEIETLLKESTMPNAEEWAIHAYEGFYTIKIEEYQSLESIVDIVGKLEEYGEPFSYYYKYFGETENFEDYYEGAYKSKEDFVYEMLESCGTIAEIEKAGLPAYYIDLEKMARDWFINDFFSVEIDYDKIYVFRN